MAFRLFRVKKRCCFLLLFVEICGIVLEKEQDTKEIKSCLGLKTARKPASSIKYKNNRLHFLQPVNAYKHKLNFHRRRRNLKRTTILLQFVKAYKLLL